MSDSLERLYLAVLVARDLDPATSRTARLFQRGPAKMAKKLAEEAIEVVIDAVHGDADAVVREMEQRELLLGIAEKMPKSPAKLAKTVAKSVAARPARRPIVALERSRLRK